MDAQKAVTYLKARAEAAESLSRFHVRVQSGMRGAIIEAVIFSGDKETTLAKVIVEESLVALQETGFDHRVNVSYPAQNASYRDLPHTFLAAASAACHLAESLDKYLRANAKAKS